MSSTLALAPDACRCTRLSVYVPTAYAYRKLRTRVPPQEDNVDVGVIHNDGSRHWDGPIGTPEAADDVAATDKPESELPVGENVATNLAHGAIICLVGPEGELMGLTTSSGKADELYLLPISTTTVEAGSSKRIQSYPSHSIFVVINQVWQLPLL